MKLLIVESGTKAKSIEKYLGKPWKVMASFGHIQDMPPKELGYNETTFEVKYEPLPDKVATIQKLKEAAASANEIYLAADPDREGEAIAAHLCSLFSNLRKPIHRVKFHEITKTAVMEAVAHPTTVSRPLVEAQETRRILDRMAGYKVSPLLWRQLSDRNLSAGRVQSAALHIICDSAHEYATWSPDIKYSLEGHFPYAPGPLVSGSSALSKSTKDQLVSLLSKKWTLSVTRSRREQKPPTPYITSTLQTDAANKLGMSIKQVMGTAQELYEAGCITYMRTDSTVISKEVKSIARSYLQKNYGPGSLGTNTIPVKQSKNAQEAHECIRPTDVTMPAVIDVKGLSIKAKQLYELIWRRTMQSLMAPVVYRTYTWGAVYDTFKLRTTEDFMDTPGFKLLDPEYKPVSKKDLAHEATLQSFIQQTVQPISLTLTPSLTSAPRLYTEGSLVSRMEELGIGRPSTYVSTLERLFARSYVELRPLPAKEISTEAFTVNTKDLKLTSIKMKLEASAMTRLMPTRIGTMVEAYIKENFPYLCDPQFTSLLENDLDAITEGKKTKQQVCKVLQKELDASIAILGKQPKVRDVETAKLDSQRILRPGIVIRKALYGPVIEIAGKEKEKPRFIPLNPYLQWRKLSMQSMPENHALFLTTLPQPYMFKDKQYQLSYGRYGFYLYDPAEKKNVPFSKRLWTMVLPK